jgi:methylthioribose-1-phosphate isomerase
MDQSDDPRELERKINQAARITSGVSDPTTVERLGAWIEELRQRLRQRKEARRIKQEITQRAKAIREEHRRPAGRDLEFWLQAESESVA